MQDSITPATIYSASNPRFAGRFPDSQHDELWLADIKACEPGGACRVFKDVFVNANPKLTPLLHFSPTEI